MNVPEVPISFFGSLRGAFRFRKSSGGLKRYAVVVLACCWTLESRSNPLGGTVGQGSASFSNQGSHLTIQTSDRAYINWQSFNIGLGESTTFVQPSSSSLVWNHINDPNPSQILGNLNANGYVVLQNSAGFFIGGQASITAHGLLMTTAPIPMPDLAGNDLPWPGLCRRGRNCLRAGSGDASDRTAPRSDRAGVAWRR